MPYLEVTISSPMKMDKSSNAISRSNYIFSNENVMYNKRRCSWTGFNNPLMIEYHDKEWGIPVHNDRTLFEFLILDGNQAGLTWQTVLNKRENYRRVSDGFHADKIISKLARHVCSNLEKRPVLDVSSI